MKKTANIILQGKGGVGKSFVASLVAQYYRESRGDNGESIACIDTDPNNSTLCGIKALNAKRLSLFDDDGQFDPRKFDKLLDVMFENADKDFVIDNGATTFIHLIEYINENGTFDILGDRFNIILHVPIVGGQAQKDTINGFVQLVEFWPDMKFVLWINEHQDKIFDAAGNKFHDMDFFKKYEENIFAAVHLEQQHEQLTGRDLKDMTRADLTFAETAESSLFAMMPRHRLQKYKTSIFEHLPEILGDGTPKKETQPK